MAAVIPEILLGELVDLLVEALSPVIEDQIREALGLPRAARAAAETSPLLIQDTVVNNHDVLTDPEDGLAAVASTVRGMASDLANMTESLSEMNTAIQNLAGFPTAAQNAAEVWGAYVYEGDAWTAGEHLRDLELFVERLSQNAGFIKRYDPFLVLDGVIKHPPD
jgi:hypothetical protein